MYRNNRNRGAIQIFITKNGGIGFINELLKEFKTLAGITDHFWKEYKFLCTTASINNYIKANNGELGKHGGDRKSKKYKQSVKKVIPRR